MRQHLEEQDNLSLIEASVSELLVEKGSIQGVRILQGKEYFAPQVILATGTFLNGLIHMGNIFPWWT
jgi:tRNA uridine 5-carboxymethylaminomethyl modification enzyme